MRGACQRMLYFNDLSIIPEDSNNQAKALFRPGPKLTASSLGVSGQHLTHIYGLVQEGTRNILYPLLWSRNKMKRLFTYLSVISESTIMDSKYTANTIDGNN